MKFTFKQITPQDLPLIYQWLDEPHVREFWDNGDDHRKDIKIFAEGRREKSNYFGDIFVYWIGLVDEEPFSFILTAIYDPKETLPDLHRKYLSKTGNTYSLDFCIGNKKFLGKSLAAETLNAFMQFFHDTIDEKADTFLIDPDVDNPRARHVYEKAGFKKVGTFTMENGFFQGEETELMVKAL